MKKGHSHIFQIRVCYISDGHSTETLRFKWPDGAVAMADHIEFPQFTLVSTKAYSCEKDYYGSKCHACTVNAHVRRTTMEVSAMRVLLMLM